MHLPTFLNHIHQTCCQTLWLQGTVFSAVLRWSEAGDNTGGVVKKSKHEKKFWNNYRDRRMRGGIEGTGKKDKTGGGRITESEVGRGRWRSRKIWLTSLVNPLDTVCVLPSSPPTWSVGYGLCESVCLKTNTMVSRFMCYLHLR